MLQARAITLFDGHTRQHPEGRPALANSLQQRPHRQLLRCACLAVAAAAAAAAAALLLSPCLTISDSHRHCLSSNVKLGSMFLLGAQEGNNPDSSSRSSAAKEAEAVLSKGCGLKHAKSCAKLAEAFASGREGLAADTVKAIE